MTTDLRLKMLLHKYEEAVACEFKTFDEMTLLGELFSRQQENGAISLFVDETMPSDAKAQYIFRPTWLTVAAMIKFILVTGDGKPEGIPYELQFRDALGFCVEYGFGGHGYEAGEHETRILKTLISCGIQLFLHRYPDFHPEFTAFMKKVADQYETLLKEEKFYPIWGESAENDIRAVVQGLTMTPLFAYGTLMRGERNHSVISDQVFIGEASAKRFVLADLGFFPAALGTNLSVRVVFGEFYLVDDNTLWNLDGLEDVGNLYDIRFCDTNRGVAQIYVWHGKYPGDAPIISDGDWRHRKGGKV